MDRYRVIEQVINEMRTKHNRLTMEDIHNGIHRLDSDGFLERVQPSKYEDQRSDLYRYSANVNYFSHYARLNTSRELLQDKLLDSKVVLLGLGGGGSTILQLLVGLGINTLWQLMGMLSSKATKSALP